MWGKRLEIITPKVMGSAKTPIKLLKKASISKR